MCEKVRVTTRRKGREGGREGGMEEAVVVVVRGREYIRRSSELSQLSVRKIVCDLGTMNPDLEEGDPGGEDEGEGEEVKVKMKMEVKVITVKK